VIPIALTIAGSDPSGGAGIQADLKTFHQLRVYGTAVVSLITVQNSTRLSRVELIEPALVTEQANAVLEDTPPNAIKTGALGSAGIIAAVAGLPIACALVVDPVMVSKQGAPLLASSARQGLIELLFPKATLVTPNLDEAADLAGIEVSNINDMREAAQRIASFGPQAVLIKGGHLDGIAIDILYHAGEMLEFAAERVETRHTHGTGCTYSAAITAFLARRMSIPEAVANAKRFITQAIRTAPGIGAGAGPLNHWADSL